MYLMPSHLRSCMSKQFWAPPCRRFPLPSIRLNRLIGNGHHPNYGKFVPLNLPPHLWRRVPIPAKIAPMKNRLCYAWFGDEDVRAILSSLENKIPSGGTGEAGAGAVLGGEGHCREVRAGPPRSQPLFKVP